MPTGFSATGAAAGGLPEVRLFDPSGLERARLLAFDSSFRGGVEVALGDVNGDGTLGYEDPGPQRVMIRLIGGTGGTGTSTDVSVDNFHVFTLG